MDSETDAIILHVRKIRNELQSEDLFQRKKALQELNKCIFQEKGSLTQSVYHQAFSESYLQIFKCLRGKSETCREYAIEIMSNFIKNLDLNDYYLTYIFPIIVERLGSVEIVEESEEIRLELVNFLDLIVSTYGKTEYLVPFLSDTVQILCQTVSDKYPKVKEASCKCVMNLAEALPRHFHMQCENLVKPVLKCFAHQHFRIRIIAIQTVGIITLHSTSGKLMEEVSGPLAERLFDQTGAVRRAVIKVVSTLMREYRDRYSHFYRLLPLILTGLFDEVPETRQEAEELWMRVGEQYEKENEKDLKDQMDFPLAPPEHYPSDVKRPGLGCRTLVQRNASKIWGAVSLELCSWQAAVRVRCAQLLCVMVMHCEEYVTQSLQDVLPAMYTACETTKQHQDRVDPHENRAVRENMQCAARMLGVFVLPRTWMQLVIPATKQCPTAGHLYVLRSIISGSSPHDLKTIAPEVANLLSMEEVRSGSRRVEYLREVVECCRGIISYPDVSPQLFTTLLTVMALCCFHNNQEEYTQVTEDARELLKRIQEPETHVIEILQQLMDEERLMISAVSSDRCVLDTLLSQWGKWLVPQGSLVGAILRRALNEQCDAEARLRTFQALSSFLDVDQQIFVDTFIKELITEVLVPSLVWRAGRSAEALRTAAASCICRALLHVTWPLTDLDDQHFNQLLITLISLTDDGAWRTRLLGVRALLSAQSKCDAKKNTHWVQEASRALLARLDDPQHTVRLEAMFALNNILQHNTSTLESNNLHHLIDTVLVHLDDHDGKIHSAAIDILRTLSREDSTYLEEKLQKQKHLFRNKEACEQLINFVTNLAL